jgi:ureidoglycolate dehydrogenase (NAD+)
MYNVTFENISNWGKNIFIGIGLNEHDSTIISNSLAQTSLWGIDSHGIARIPHYLNRIEEGSINKRPNIVLSKTAFSTGNVNGDDGHGILIMHKSAQYAIEIAQFSGIGIIGISNSSHCGAIGLYTRQISEQGMIGIAFTHSDSLVIPQNGNQAFLGTNPISIAIPTLNPSEPLCVDMATSIIPWNIIMNAKRENIDVPITYGVDINGIATTKSRDIVAVKPMAEHKGYALAFLIDMLCGPLNGMAFGQNITPMYKELDKKRKLGSLVIAINPEMFAGLDFIKIASSLAIQQVKKQDNAVLFPGEPEYISESRRKQFGIPVTESMRVEFDFWSDKLNQPSLKYIKNV